MKNSIFRMYDIRGKVGSELILSEVYDLGCGIAAYFNEKDSHTKTVVVGMDGRTHSPAIKELLCAALQDSGLDVVFLGIIPSPILYFALHTMPFDAGIMITASHNPKEYNGFKICLGKQSLWGDAIQDIKRHYQTKSRIKNAASGEYREISLLDAYLAYLIESFPALLNLDMPLVLDCGNGATGAVIPTLVSRFGWSNAQILYAEVDGEYPHHEADPVVEENMYDLKCALKKSDAVIGIGFDGDGDRMAAVTKNGYLVPGDQMLVLLSKEFITKHPGSGVVFDIKSSSATLEAVQLSGGKPILSPSGHSLIKKSMKDHHALIGGELSGHFFFFDAYFGFDDALYAALRLLDLLKKTKLSLDELVQQLPKKISSPEFRIACAEEQKWFIVDAVRLSFASMPEANIVTLDGVRATLPCGLGIVRASNTQPVISMRFEADTVEHLEKIKELFIDALEPFFNRTVLQQQLM